MPESEVNSLIVKAHERIDAAVLLQTDGYYEDAVSRAYYAMFYAARALLVSEGIVVKTHRGMITKIGELYVKTGKMDSEIWRNFASGESLRESAEYGGEMIITSYSSEIIISNARNFIDVCEKILKIS